MKSIVTGRRYENPAFFASCPAFPVLATGDATLPSLVSQRYPTFPALATRSSTFPALTNRHPSFPALDTVTYLFLHLMPVTRLFPRLANVACLLSRVLIGS